VIFNELNISACHCIENTGFSCDASGGSTFVFGTDEGWMYGGCLKHKRVGNSRA
jgi:hypothetical protein